MGDSRQPRESEKIFGEAMRHMNILNNCVWYAKGMISEVEKGIIIIKWKLYFVLERMKCND